MGININQLGFKYKFNRELDNSIYKISEEERKQLYLRLKREEQEKIMKEQEEKLKKMNKD